MRTLKEMFPERSFTALQEDFFKDCLETFNTDTDTGVITVLPYRCGLGKSTFLQAYIQASLDQSDYGMIIVTDRVKRLASLRHYDLNDEELDHFWRHFVRHRNKISILTMENKDFEVEEQRYKPILLMTTQRYFQMDLEKLKRFLEYESSDGTIKKRTQIIFDEPPSFYDVHQISISSLHDVIGALKDGIDDRCQKDVKEWAVSQFKAFAESLESKVEEFEYIRAKNTVTWFDFDRDSITEDDDKFIHIVEVYKNSIRRKKIMSIQNIEDCKILVQNGALLFANKVKAGDSYEKSFIVVKDYIDHFFLDDEDIKIFVLDGTADIASSYPDCDYIRIKDCSNFNVDMSYMDVKILQVNTSRNAIISKDKDDKTKQIIEEYISKQNLKPDDSLLVTYKSLIDVGTFEKLNHHRGYFGNLRGFNEYKDLHNYIQIGLNRQRDTNYLSILLHQKPELIDTLRGMDEAKRIEYIDKLLSGKTKENDPITGIWQEELKDFMISEIAADTIQNIYRIASRNIENTDKVNVYLFYDDKHFKPIRDYLQYAFGNHGANITVDTMPELARKKIMERKNGSGGQSVAQRIMDWIDNIPKGQQFTTSEIRKALKLTSKQFQKAKDRNEKLQEILTMMYVERGLFIKH